MSRARRLSANDQRLLWALSGGFCEFPGCTQVLVFEDAEKLVNIGEVAHVIAHSKGGPRGRERQARNLGDEEVDAYKNTILLCRNHHRQVDQNPEAYPADLLLEWKRQHEDRIRSIKGRKNVVCLLHKAKGPPIDQIRAQEDLNMNFVGLVSLQQPIDEQPNIDWGWAKSINAEKFRELMALRSNRCADGFVVLALSPIPMLVHLGYLITDTIPVEVFQYDPDSAVWVRDRPGSSQCNQLTTSSPFQPSNATALVVSFSVTSPIERSDIAAVVPQGYDLLELSLPGVGTSRVLCREDVLSCKKQFRERVETILRAGHYSEVHLFYAGPATLAVEIGRCINANMWPSVHTYYYRRRRTPRYELAITI